MSQILTHEVMGKLHEHEYPDDWKFGGANDCDPRADPRWMPTVYTYYGSDTQWLWVTVTPICDLEALEAFSSVAAVAGADPRWVQATRPGGKKEMLPYLYDAETDTVNPR